MLENNKALAYTFLLTTSLCTQERFCIKKMFIIILKSTIFQTEHSMHDRSWSIHIKNQTYVYTEKEKAMKTIALLL